MARFDDRKHCPPGAKRPALDRDADVQDVIDSLVSRLDAVQRRAFYEKMMQLDDSRAQSAAPSGARKSKTASRPAPWLC